MTKKVVFYSSPARFAADCNKMTHACAKECPALQECQASRLPVSTQAQDARVEINVANVTIGQMATIRQICLKCQHTK